MKVYVEMSFSMSTEIEVSAERMAALKGPAEYQSGERQLTEDEHKAMGEAQEWILAENERLNEGDKKPLEWNNTFVSTEDGEELFDL